MKRQVLALPLIMATAGPARGTPAAVVRKPALLASRATGGTVKVIADEALPPADGDPDHQRIQRLQEALYNIVHGPVLGRLRVGVRVMDVGSGRLLFGQHGSALMDPASNQKVLATATALLRLGGSWQFRTELIGPASDGDGNITGDLVLRGSGDPSLRSAHLEEMAAQLAARGITRVDGAVLGDPRRIGSTESDPGGHSPLRVSRAAIEIRVRPGDREGAAPLVSVRPASEAFVVENHARTGGRGRGRVAGDVSAAGGRIPISVNGRIPAHHPRPVVGRVPPHLPPLPAA